MLPFARSVVAVASLLCAVSALAQNVVQRENMKAGSPDWVLLNPATNHEIEGYASATSVNRGEQIKLYVSTAEPTYTIDIYRTGWYGGAGARRVAGPITRTGTLQPAPVPDPATGLIECSWTDPYVVTVPNTTDLTDWASGVYLAKLTSGSSHHDEYIVFVVRDDARHSSHYFQASVTTYQAYNEWGGKSLYSFNSSGGVPAQKVSFNRPYLHGAGSGEYLFRWEYNMVRFLEREGYDVAYSTDVDTHRRGALLRNHHDFLVVGHDEYWSDEMRASVTGARDAGVNLGIFAANVCYWQIRLEPSTTDASQPDRTIVAYKEAFARDPYYTDGDPSNDHLVTNTWRLAPVNNSEDSLIGVMYVADPVDADIVIDDVNSTPWLFDKTNLSQGTHLPGLLGYEVDKIGPRSPSPITRLGHSPFTTNKTNGDPNISDASDMTIYTAASGAEVFATGSIQFALGLDNWNAGATGDRTDASAQQMTRNLLARFAGTDAGGDCQYALSPSSLSVSAKSGSASIQLTSQCGWSTVPDVSWITVTPVSGFGSAAIGITYTANSTAAPRTGHVQIGDRVFTLTQARPCSYAVSPPSFTFGVSGGTGSVAITTDPGCFWTSSVSSSYPWITITGGASGGGSGTTTFRVAANDSTRRNATVIVAGNAVAVSQQAYATAAQSDFDGDHRADILLRANDSGDVGVWLMNGATIVRGGFAGASPNSLAIAGVGDFDGDGRADILWRDAAGGVGVWFMNGTAIQSGAFIGSADRSMSVAGIGDLDGDGRDDILWRDASGAVGVWFMNGRNISAGALIGEASPSTLIAAVADFDGDGKADILWRDPSGGVGLWLMNGSSIARGAFVGNSPPSLVLASAADVDGDGKADILWTDANGGVGFWLMNGGAIVGSGYAGRMDSAYRFAAFRDFDGDHRADILWITSSGDAVVWLMNGAVVSKSGYAGSAGPGYTFR